MTPGQRQWLEKLKSEGMQRRPRYGAFPSSECKMKGWTEGNWVDDETGKILELDVVLACDFKGVHSEESITDQGRKALSVD